MKPRSSNGPLNFAATQGLKMRLSTRRPKSQTRLPNSPYSYGTTIRWYQWRSYSARNLRFHGIHTSASAQTRLCYFLRRRPHPTHARFREKVLLSLHGFDQSDFERDLPNDRLRTCV